MHSPTNHVSYWIRQRQAIDRYYLNLKNAEREAIDAGVQESIKPLRDCLEPEVRPGNGLDKALQRERHRLRMEATAKLVFGELRAAAPAVEDADGRHPGMVYIPSGEVVQGVEKGFMSREESQQRVCVPGFWMDVTTTTNSQFHELFSTHTPDIHSNEPDMPAVALTWYDAAKFAGSLGKRLPTQAEWERAARGPEGCVYSFGNEFDRERANIWPSRGARPASDYPPSPWGLYQMCGNVWEWTAEVYTHSFAEHQRICYNLARGGSWRHCKAGAKATISICLDLTQRSDNVGFRCVCSY